MVTVSHLLIFASFLCFEGACIDGAAETHADASCLLQSRVKTTDDLETPKDVEVRMPKQDIPAANTMRCIVFEWFADEMVDVGAWEAVPSDPYKVHHSSLFSCGELQPGVVVGKSFNCMDHPKSGCAKGDDLIGGYEHMIAGSPVEKSRFMIPSGVSYRIGRGTPRKYGRLEVHNNAPIVGDESGFKLSVKPVLDPTQSPKLQAFHACWDLTEESPPIPSHQSDWVLQKELPVLTNGFHLYGVHLHYHTAGSRLLLEIQHGDGQRSAVAERKGSSGSTLMLDSPIQVLPGEKLIGSCHYDTSSRTKPTPFGNDPNENEMCDVFLMGFASTKQPTSLMGQPYPSDGQ